MEGKAVLANYHTHTPRCHHAEGTEREYVEKAIKRGVKTLGFSDHSPYLFEGEWYPNNRMRPEEFEGYMRTVRDLAREYAGEITLLCGVEIEYYPGAFERTVRFLRELDCDYLLLGQHYVGVEEQLTFSKDQPGVFDRYIDQVCTGLETGMMTYVCHPDFCCCLNDLPRQEKGWLRLCETAKRMGAPLEINLQGLAQGRHYPRRELFEMAAAVGNEVVLGCDAHQVYRMAVPQEVEMAHAFAAYCGVKVVELSAEQVLARKKNIG